MSRSSFIGFALGAAATFALQGCGSGGESSATTTTTMQGSTTPGVTHTTTVTTTTIKMYPGGLPECLDVSTFRYVNYVNDVKAVTGQCYPSLNPGAFYTKEGQKGDDGKSDKNWQCFGATTSPYQWTNEFAKSQGFEGACLFGDYNNTIKPEKVEDCALHSKVHPMQCAPGPSEVWGACYSSKIDAWKCLRKGYAEIPGDVKGDCKAQVDANGEFYGGVCRFPEEKAITYKCDTVKSYSPGNAGTCGGGSTDYDKACFTLQEGVNWPCWTKANNTGVCDWTLLPDSSLTSPAYYRGRCVFKNSEEYENATDASDLTEAMLYRSAAKTVVV